MTLFIRKSDQTRITFDCIQLSKREFDEITTLIEQHGGECGKNVWYTIKFLKASEFSMKQYPEGRYYDINFIQRCIEQSKLLDLNLFSQNVENSREIVNNEKDKLKIAERLESQEKIMPQTNNSKSIITRPNNSTSLTSESESDVLNIENSTNLFLQSVSDRNTDNVNGQIVVQSDCTNETQLDNVEIKKEPDTNISGIVEKSGVDDVADASVSEKSSDHISGSSNCVDHSISQTLSNRIRIVEDYTNETSINILKVKEEPVDINISIRKNSINLCTESSQSITDCENRNVSSQILIDNDCMNVTPLDRVEDVNISGSGQNSGVENNANASIIENSTDYVSKSSDSEVKVKRESSDEESLEILAWLPKNSDKEAEVIDISSLDETPNLVEPTKSLKNKVPDNSSPRVEDDDGDSSFEVFLTAREGSQATSAAMKTNNESDKPRTVLMTIDDSNIEEINTTKGIKTKELTVEKLAKNGKQVSESYWISSWPIQEEKRHPTTKCDSSNNRRKPKNCSIQLRDELPEIYSRLHGSNMDAQKKFSKQSLKVKSVCANTKSPRKQPSQEETVRKNSFHNEAIPGPSGLKIDKKTSRKNIHCSSSSDDSVVRRKNVVSSETEKSEDSESDQEQGKARMNTHKRLRKRKFFTSKAHGSDDSDDKNSQSNDTKNGSRRKTSDKSLRSQKQSDNGLASGSKENDTIILAEKNSDSDEFERSNGKKVLGKRKISSQSEDGTNDRKRRVFSKNRESESDIEFDEADNEDQEREGPGWYLHRPRSSKTPYWRSQLDVRPNKIKATHRHFTEAERRVMVDHLLGYDDIVQAKPKGLVVWRAMLNQGHLPHRTVQSVHNHFLKKVLPNIKYYYHFMTEAQIRQFKRILE